MTKDRPRIWHLRAEGAPVATLATLPLGEGEDAPMAVGAALVTPPDTFCRKTGVRIASGRCRRAAARHGRELSSRDQLRGTKMGAVVDAWRWREWARAVHTLDGTWDGAGVVHGQVRLLMERGLTPP